MAGLTNQDPVRDSRAGTPLTRMDKVLLSVLEQVAAFFVLVPYHITN